MHASTTIRLTAILLAIACTVLIALNLATSRNDFWAIWPIWAATIAAATVIVAVRLRSVVLGLWLGGGGVVVVGLVAIDVTDGPDWWAFWPAAAWLVLGALFTALSIDLLAGIPTTTPRQPNDD